MTEGLTLSMISIEPMLHLFVSSARLHTCHQLNSLKIPLTDVCGFSFFT